MSRHTLPQTQQRASESAFFPSFQKEMDRLLDHFRSSFPMIDGDSNAGFAGPSFPAIDVVETENSFEISAEVPGVKEEDLDVSISGESLILKGEKSADREEKEENYHLVERRFGSFRRQIPLGFVPEDNAVNAEFSDGILKLKIMKPAAFKANVQKINIKKS